MRKEELEKQAKRDVDKRGTLRADDRTRPPRDPERYFRDR